MSRLFRVAALSPHTMICSPSPVSTIVTGNPGRHEYRVGGLKLNLRAVVEMDGDAVVLSNRRDSAFLLSHCRSMPLGQSPPVEIARRGEALRDVERRAGALWSLAMSEGAADVGEVWGYLLQPRGFSVP